MPGLRVLYVKADGISGQESLAHLPHLEQATFELAEPTAFSALSGVRKLKRLTISGTLGEAVLSDAGFLAGMTALTHLDLGDNGIEDLTPLSGLSELRHLVLSGNPSLRDIAPLTPLSGLQNLQLRNTQVSDLSPLRGMDRLGILWLDRAPVANISVLADLPNLWGLELSRTQVTDITPLANVPLRHLSLRGTSVTDFSAVPAGTKLKK